MNLRFGQSQDMPIVTMEGASKRISPADWKACAGCVVEFPQCPKS